jgi:hypothetical protein
MEMLWRRGDPQPPLRLSISGSLPPGLDLGVAMTSAIQVNRLML